MEISQEGVLKSGVVVKATQAAWSEYIRRESGGRDCVSWAQRRWDLSHGRAHGAVYQTITQSTIDHIAAHENGGLRVELAVMAVRYRMSADELLASYIEKERGAIAHERRRIEAAEARMVALRRRLSDDGPLDTV